MLTKEQLKIIDDYVDDTFYYKDRLIKYLNMHDCVGNEVFDYVDRKNRNLNRKEAHSSMLDDELGYQPVPVDVFVRRIPLYFYTWDGDILSDRGAEDIGDILRSKWEEIEQGEIELESIYLDLEYMFYEKHIPPYYIYNYVGDQTGLVRQEYFFEWVEYLHICDEQGWTELMPDNFITAYNFAREAVGLEPRIFTPIWDAHDDKPYYKDGKILTFEGVFPCDKNGNPIMRWVGLKFQNGYRALNCTCKKARSGYLHIEIQPDTVVYFRDTDDEGEYWNQVYAGPKTMEFDHTVLKERREHLKYTQQEVADAVGANIRTYQKWEYGDTQPDGYYLLRLMNWLDIPSIPEAVKYDIPE